MQLAVHYPDMAGRVAIREIVLKPGAGERRRFAVEGWGLIQIQANLAEGDPVPVRIAVNSERRAACWTARYSEMGNPADWNWPAVGRHRARHGRLARKWQKQERG